MKLTKPFFFLFNSVFSKLLIILIITGVFINISVLLFFKFGFSDIYRKPFRQNINEHIHYLMEDLGSPPDREQAKYVTLKSGFDVFYKSGNETWTTADGDLSFEQIRKKFDERRLKKHHFGKHFSDDKDDLLEKKGRKKNLISYLETRLTKVSDEKDRKVLKQRLSRLKKRPGIKLGLVDRRLMVLYETENESIIFYKSKVFSDKATVAFVTLLTGLTFIVLISWFMIRKTLKPIKELSSGVEHVSQGDLSFQVSQNGNDELGRLSGAFNEMTQQIKKMLHAKEELLIDISHELRSPVTRVKVAMEFLPESEVRKSINDDILEIETMINEILESARLTTEHGRPEKEKTVIRKLLHDIIESDKGYRQNTNIVMIPETISLMIDPEQIKTVIRNVLDNAIKYSDNEDSSIEIRYRQKKKYGIIEIKDNGRGIPEDELPYIFEPFYRVDKSRSKKTGGYGLGLNLCRNIMEAHGGKAEASSINMQGTSIFLYFPED